MEQKLRITQQQVAESPTFQCSCGSYLFEESIIFKKISPILSPTGKEELAPINAIICKKCGKIPERFNVDKVFPKELVNNDIKLNI